MLFRCDYIILKYIIVVLFCVWGEGGVLIRRRDELPLDADVFLT